jgi:hypothetical protein
LAIRPTCLAMGAGRDTLRRTCLIAGIASLYTSLVHLLGPPKRLRRCEHPRLENRETLGHRRS